MRLSVSLGLSETIEVISIKFGSNFPSPTLVRVSFVVFIQLSVYILNMVCNGKNAKVIIQF